MRARGSVRAVGAASSADDDGAEGGRHRLLWPWPGAALAGLASGSETGWDIGSARVGRLVLGAVMTALSRHPGPSLGALDRALDSAARALAAFDLEPDPFEMSSPSATLLVGCVTAERAELAWLGGERALLVRGGRTVAATRPHLLAEAYRYPFTRASEDRA